jgi:hypothetical protein
MKKIFLILSMIGLLGAGCSGNYPPSEDAKRSGVVESAKLFAYTVLGLKFASPVELPVLVDIGASKNTAYSIGIADKNNNQDFEVVFFVVPTAMREAMLDQKAVLNYGKSTYLASAEPGTEEVKRTFYNKEITGEKQKTTIPEPSVVESYVVELPSGKWLFIGARYKESFSKETAESIISGVLNTLRE